MLNDLMIYLGNGLHENVSEFGDDDYGSSTNNLIRWIGTI